MDNIEKILKATALFDNLDQPELQAIINNSARIEIPSGGMIANEGEEGNECYVILHGSVQVFTIMPDAKEIVLAKVSEGDVIGEQALLPEGTGKRNASLRAYTDTSLLAIPKKDFLKTLSRDQKLKNRLLRLGEAQIRNKLHKQSVLFRSLPFDEIADHFSREQEFADGTIIFNEGDPGDKVYLVVSGKADVYKKSNGGQKFLVQIKAGGIFGELAILEKKPRAATVIAHGTLKVFSIDNAPFLKLYEQSPKLREYMQTLKKIYPMVGVGFATQHLGRFMEMDCITTVCALANGRSIVSSRVIGMDIFNMSLTEEFNEEDTETIIFRDNENKIERELKLSGPRIVAVTSWGHWPELGKIYRSALEQIPLDPAQKIRFKVDGTLFRETKGSEHFQDHQIICNCLQVNYGQLRHAVQSGANDVNGLMQTTGAGSVCGSCRFSLQTLYGEAEWIPVHVDKVINASDCVRSFRLQPIYDNNLTPAKAGQHILIQGKIANQWVQRTYTISSAEQETDYREITVKKESDGVFSTWLFDQDPIKTTLRITDPQGNFSADLTSKKPIVCLVSGIGVTPALSICRSLIKAGASKRLHIDYSASTQNQFIYRQEFESASKNAMITVKLRTTQETGRLTCTDIRQLTQDYPDADFFICGSTDYEKAVRQYLAKSAIPEQRVHVDHFYPAGGQPAPQGKGYFYLGLLLLLAFIAQDLFQLKWPWLETLQQHENYRIGSGLLLALYIVVQFVLPLKRRLGKFEDAARLYQLHKLLGALAPLPFYFHSTQLHGYAYLKLLTLLYFANFILGLFNQERVANPKIKKSYSFYWLLTHVFLSVLLAGLLVFHIYVALAY